jgi:hypothetical protein
LTSRIIKKSRFLKLQSLLTVVAFILILAFGVVSEAQAGTISSEMEGHWAQSTIQEMVKEGVISGYSDGTFRPDNNITKAEFATLIVKAFALEPGPGKVFEDTAGHWAKETISTANYHGLVSGYSDALFGPDDPITREQMAVMIANATGAGAAGENIVFTDSAQISDWAKEAVMKTAAAGLFTGYPEGTFKPQANATRAEAAVVISKGLKFINKEVLVTTFDSAGTYGPASGTEAIGGNVVISAGGVTLQNTVITGNLVISEKVGSGEVTLNNVTVEGTTFIRGGGKDSIRIHGGQYNNITIENTPGGGLRLVTADVEGMPVIISERAAGEEIILEGTFKNVAIKADNVVLITTGKTSIEEIKVDEKLKNTAINLEKGTAVKKLVLDSKAAVNNAEGTVEEISGAKASESDIKNPPKKVVTPPPPGPSLTEGALSRAAFNTAAAEIKKIEVGDQVVAAISYRPYQVTVNIKEAGYLFLSGTGIFGILEDLGVKQISFDNQQWFTVTAANAIDILMAAEIEDDDDQGQQFSIAYKAKIQPKNHVEFIENFIVIFILPE